MGLHVKPTLVGHGPVAISTVDIGGTIDTSILPVAILTHNEGLAAGVDTCASGGCGDKNIVGPVVGPTRNVTVVMGTFFMPNGDGINCELGIEIRFIERKFPRDDGRSVAVPANELPHVFLRLFDKGFVSNNWKPGMGAMTKTPSSSQASRKAGSCG